MIRSVLARLRALMFWTRQEAELDEELRYHLDPRGTHSEAAWRALMTC